MQKAIVFIDGNNVYHNVKSLDIRPSRIIFKKLIGLICSELNLELKDAFYYNSVPNIKTLGEKKYYEQMAIFDEIEKSGIKVKTRKLQHKTNYELISRKLGQLENIKLCENCKPIIVQNCIECIGSFQEKEKGIDVMIAVDMIEKALKDEYDVAVLISGDADFIPVFDLIKFEKKRVVSAFFSKGFSTELKTTQEHIHIDKFLYESLKEQRTDF